MKTYNLKDVIKHHNKNPKPIWTNGQDLPKYSHIDLIYTDDYLLEQSLCSTETTINPIYFSTDHKCVHFIIKATTLLNKNLVSQNDKVDINNEPAYNYSAMTRDKWASYNTNTELISKDLIKLPLQLPQHQHQLQAFINTQWASLKHIINRSKKDNIPKFKCHDRGSTNLPLQLRELHNDISNITIII
ncbi:hypothetical protein C1645_822432 [Glomus cerebriforme]|uniref:Endonuclease/exonuclease/phosphatase domain-containing protein n=1 Tax=Glomus cerebriforme TaxID=658196 RepID=A0A397T2K4_9GLOM|nr:hypothetical protein C1645_822432 [Glomus cerebriforme]